ncbi:MAG: ABC transporter permease [Acidobacteria bacterium]|nr:ABC transporter permease [Acidobacteriota bacterium]
MNFVNSFRAEWLKRRRSLASWLVVVGAFFTPSIITASRIKNHAALAPLYAADDFWRKLWNQSWESMEVFLLPIGIILATGLIAQIEYKNNTWKQLHTTPQSYTTVYAAKLLVVLLMLVQVFALFNVGVYLSAVIPSALFAGVPYPAAPIPFDDFWAANVNFFVDCLPIVALQYLLSLHFRNFLVPVGAGFALWFLGVGLLSWEYSYLFPYNHGAINFLTATGHFDGRKVPFRVEHLALVYAAAFTAAGWLLYVTKREKG